MSEHLKKVKSLHSPLWNATAVLCYVVLTCQNSVLLCLKVVSLCPNIVLTCLNIVLSYIDTV